MLSDYDRELVTGPGRICGLLWKMIHCRCTERSHLL